METVIGHNYTSNTAKLLKHLDKLRGMQRGRVSPVMVHIAPTNVCNLHCAFCCYGNRDLKQSLTLQQVKTALWHFKNFDTCGVEFTGGGEATLWPHLDEAADYAHSLGYRIGLITNGVKPQKFDSYDLLDWCRVSLHALDEGISMDASIEHIRSINPYLDISSVYIWNGAKSEENFGNVVAFTERHKIPTRVTPNLTLGKESIDEMMQNVANQIAASGGHYVFLSDFNVKTTRAHNECYMHMIKPFVYSDGNVYVCPSAALSPENQMNVNEQFKVCAIEDIHETYSKGVTRRMHDCKFCKYSGQNELISEVLRPVTHHAFA